MQKPNLQFDSEEDLRKFLKEAREKSDEEAGRKPDVRNVEEIEDHQYEIPAPPYPAKTGRGGMNNKYHYYRMVIFLLGGVAIIAYSNNLITALGIGLVALAIILHQASMVITLREERW